MMYLDLDKVNPEFRNLTDLLFFSDRSDLDLSEFKSLLKSNYNVHYNYFWNRFQKSSEIFWGAEFWNNRISFILSLNDKNFSKKIERRLEQRMWNLIKFKDKIDVRYDVEYLQFLEYCKIRKSKQKSFQKIKSHLVGLPSYVNHKKLVQLIESFIPIIFNSFNDYIELLCKNITSSHTSIKFLIFSKNNNINFDNLFLVDLFFNLIKNTKTSKNFKNRFIILDILNDSLIRQQIKESYKPHHRDLLLKIMKHYSYIDLDESFFKNFKNLIDLDESLVEPLLDIYASQLFTRYTSHKRANIDRLSKLVKFVPQISPKKVLSWLSLNNKIPDIKYFFSIYPELKKLAAFA